ncbi:MAG: HAD family hydrolase [Solirubrobacteraceae bacterium]
MAIRGLKHRAVLLDALGTLLELQPPAPRLRAELAGRFDLAISQSQAERAIAAEIAYYRQHLDEGRDEAGLADLRRRCAAALSHELAGSLGQKLPSVQEMTDALLASLSFRVFDDVLPTLRALKDLGLRLIVVSNWDVSLPGVLDHLGLSASLAGVLTSAQAGFRKPHPAIFDLALRLAQARAEEAIHVGDSLEEDVAGARAAGLEPVLIRRSGPGPGGVPVIRTLEELPALLSGPRLAPLSGL